MLSFLNLLRLLPGVEAKINYLYAKALLFCMTKRLFPASRGKAQEDKRKGISHLREYGPHSSDEGNFYIKPTFMQGVSEKLLKNGEHKSIPEHTFIWHLTANQQCSVPHF